MKPAKMVRKHIANKVSAIAASMIRDHEKADMVCELAGQPAMFQFLDVAKDRVTAGELTQLQKEYRAFFLELLAKFGAASPSDLKDEQKKEFYKEIRDKWATGEGVSKNKMVDQPKEGNDGEGEGEDVKQAAADYFKPKKKTRKVTAADLGVETAVAEHRHGPMSLKEAVKFLWNDIAKGKNNVGSCFIEMEGAFWNAVADGGHWAVDGDALRISKNKPGSPVRIASNAKKVEEILSAIFGKTKGKTFTLTPFGRRYLPMPRKHLPRRR